MLDYKLKNKTPPAAEPINIEECKTHLRVDGNEEDAYIESLIISAREYCEAYQNRAYITQTWYMFLQNFPTNNVIEVPKGNLQSVNAFRYKNATGQESDMLVNIDFVYSTNGILGEITPVYGKTWPCFTPFPLDTITIEFVCGYGNAVDVPHKVKHAMLLLISYWYENREAAIKDISKEVSFSVHALLNQERLMPI